MRRPILIAATAVLLSTTAPVLGDEFLAGFEDVPVMPGIVVDDNGTVAFDTPAGRIVEAYAAGDVTESAVRQFYRSSLPQLGWVRNGDLSFLRHGETLTLELLDKPPSLTVRFRLAPAEKR